MGEFLALLASLFFAFSNLFINKGIIKRKLDKYNGYFLSIAVNNALNFAILPFIILFTFIPAANWRGILFFVIAGVLTSLAGRLLMFECIERIGASRAVTLKVTSPFFTVLLGILVLGERLSHWVLLGIVIVLLGITFVSRETLGLVVHKKEDLSTKVQHNKSQLRLGIFLGILAGLGFGLGSIFRKMGVQHFPNPLLGAVIGSFTAMLCLLLFSTFTNKIKINVKTLSPGGICWSFLKAGLFINLALFSVYFALHLAPVSIVSSLESIEPFWTILLGAIMFKKIEIVTVPLIMGALIVVSGVLLIVVF